MSSETDGKATIPSPDNSGGFKDSALGKIIFGKDQDSKMALFQMGLSMMQPQQAGTNFGSNLVNSIGSGFNYLGNLERARNKAGLAQQTANTNEMQAQANAQLAATTGANIERKAEQFDMKNALDLYGSDIEANRVSSVLAAATSKLSGEKDERKTKLMQGLLDIQKATVEAGGQFDTEQFMSTWNLIDSGWRPDKIAYRVSDGRFYVSSAALDGFSEEGERVSEVRPITPAEVSAFGGNPEDIKAFYIKAFEAEQAKGVGEKLEERGVEPTSPEPAPVMADVEDIAAETPLEGDALKRVLRLRELKGEGPIGRAIRGIMTQYPQITEEKAREIYNEQQSKPNG